MYPGLDEKLRQFGITCPDTHQRYDALRGRYLNLLYKETMSRLCGSEKRAFAKIQRKMRRIDRANMRYRKYVNRLYGLYFWLSNHGEMPPLPQWLSMSEEKYRAWVANKPWLVADVAETIYRRKLLVESEEEYDRYREARYFVRE